MSNEDMEPTIVQSDVKSAVVHATEKKVLTLPVCLPLVIMSYQSHQKSFRSDQFRP